MILRIKSKCNHGRWAPLKRVLIGVLSASVLMSGPVFATTGAGDIQAGKKLSENCAMCHGVHGNSSNPAFPSLAGQSRGYLLEQLHAYRDGKRLCYGHPTMSVMTHYLSDQQMADLAAYYAQQPRKVAKSTGIGSVVGHHLYHFGRAQDQVGACEYCHGVHGKGHVFGNDDGFPTLRGLSEAYVRATLHEFRHGYRVGGHTHIMQHISSKLSDGDIEALASYIAHLN